MVLPRALRTIGPIIAGIIILTVLLIIPISNIENTQNNVLVVQKIVGIAQIIVGISTFLIVLPAASLFYRNGTPTLWNA